MDKAHIKFSAYKTMNQFGLALLPAYTTKKRDIKHPDWAIAQTADSTT